jgi:hypothetical protein
VFNLNQEEAENKLIFVLYQSACVALDLQLSRSNLRSDWLISPKEF